MRSIVTVCAIAGCMLLYACDKPTAKFHAGDKVMVKAHPDTKGVVLIRMSPFRDDLYYLRVPGKPDSRTSTWIMSSSGRFSRHWHLEGPYYDSQLALERQ
jgi:hypothetical protein